jgi:hypothetical protein
LKLSLQSKAILKAACRVSPILCLLAHYSVCASAAVVTFTGEDLNAGPGSAHPVSSAAAGSFTTAASAIGNVSTINFESSPVGSFNSLVVAPGVTLTGTNYNGGNQAILNASNSPSFPSLDGFNTTPGATNFVEIYAGTLTFTFATPTQFFGGYLTGIQTYFFQDTFTFSDGTSETINVPGTGTTNSVGALDFVGFTDAGKSITSVTINAGTSPGGADYIGIDDVLYQSTPTTAPEPTSVFLAIAGGFMLAFGFQRRSKR